MIPFALTLVGGALQLTLTGEITIEHVQTLTDKLKAKLLPGVALEIDASQLTRLDAAALQVLLASAQLASDTVLTESSPAWTEAFTRYASPDPFRSI